MYATKAFTNVLYSFEILKTPSLNQGVFETNFKKRRSSGAWYESAATHERRVC